MKNLLTEAQQFLASNKSDQAAREFMTTEQRDVLTEDYAARKQFLSASHFTPDKRKKFERLFWESIKPKHS